MLQTVHTSQPRILLRRRQGRPGGAKKKSLADVECYLCEEKGHCVRDCPKRKSLLGKVHVSIEEPEGDDESERDVWSDRQWAMSCAA